MKVGYLRCAACGAETNCVELTAGSARPAKMSASGSSRSFTAGMTVLFWLETSPPLRWLPMRWRAMSVSGGSGCLLRPLWLKCAAP